MTLKRQLLLVNKMFLSRYAPVGGQAVIEGVMMRSPRTVATAVQRSSGEIILESAPFRSITKRVKLLGIPVVRGMAGLVETLVLGMRSLAFSANEAAKDEEAKSGGADREGKEEGGISNWSLGLTMALALGLGLLLFFYLPLKLTEWTGVQGRIGFNLVDGAFRLVFFLAYLWGISRWGEMRRLFQYHGAEHKVIHTFEAGLPITPEEAAPFTTLHPRCGTSFLFSLMILSIVVFTFFGRPETAGERLLRFAGVPFIAGLGFEYIRLSGRFAHNPLVNMLAQPGLWLQRLTTQEPDRAQLAVACRALESVLPLTEEDEQEVRVM